MTGTRWTREQADAIRATGHTLLAANAGTGKTTTVVGKILWHLVAGPPRAVPVCGRARGAPVR